MSLKSLAGFTGLFAVVAVVLAVMCASCSSPVAVKQSETATVTVKMGCYKTATICPDIIAESKVFVVSLDTILEIEKGKFMFIIWDYDTANGSSPREDNFRVEHDTTFNYSNY